MNMSPAVHPIYAGMETTIFETMSGLARELGAINLGQGFPDDPGAPELVEAAVRALRGRSNQYPPGPGLPELRDAVCDFYRRRQGMNLAREQVIVTSGATEALTCAVMALVAPGDEVILFQPAYDAYAPLVRRCGGEPVSVPLAPPDWRYDAAALEAAITARTRVVMFNDPLNPTGTVATEEELAAIAQACTAHDLVAICDEVWETVRFGGTPHASLMTFPGMAERTVKIGSAGKIFGMTGWKTGWMIAAPPLAAGLARAHQFVTYASPVPLQWAAAEGLALPDQWFAAQHARWAAGRDRLRAGLAGAGFAVLDNAATWFVCVDLAASGVMLDDREFAMRAVREAGVATIPISALFEGEHAPRHVLRFCFTKPDAMLDAACQRLHDFRDRL